MRERQEGAGLGVGREARRFFCVSSWDAGEKRSAGSERDAATVLCAPHGVSLRAHGARERQRKANQMRVGDDGAAHAEHTHTVSAAATSVLSPGSLF